MDSNAPTRLMVMGIGPVVIGLASIMVYFGTCLAAPEDKKMHKAALNRLYGLILLTPGSVYLIYSMFTFSAQLRQGGQEFPLSPSSWPAGARSCQLQALRPG